MYCRPIKRAKAITPSAKVTSLDRMIVANVEPRATVTTRSKAFILESVRFPDRRRNAISTT